MCPFKQYPVLQSLLSPFRGSQRKTLALFIASIAEVAQACSLQVASHVALQVGIQMGSALNRFYRLLRNPRIDDQTLTSQILRLLAAPKERLLIAIDWTAWHDPWQMLIASVVVGRRAIPVQSKVTSRTLPQWSQNKEEEELLRSLVSTLEDVMNFEHSRIKMAVETAPATARNLPSQVEFVGAIHELPLLLASEGRLCAFVAANFIRRTLIIQQKVHNTL